VSDSPPTPRDWAAAAAALGRRVTARARLQAFLRPFAVGLALAAVAAVVARAAMETDLRRARAVLVCLAGVGAIAGLLRARRVPPVALGDAAWALDRLSGARERGMTAALASAPVAEEAAALSPTGPARVRLRPPAGLVAAASAALLATVAWTWPAPAPEEPADPDAAEAASASPASGEGAATAADARAAVLAREARAVSEAREALGLPPRTALDPTGVAERLAAPATSEEAVEAARRALARADGAPPGAADPTVDALARRISEDPAARAEALRRDAIAARASSTAARVPPGRQETVARYLALRATAREGR
jgi:hypothetical protein